MSTRRAKQIIYGAFYAILWLLFFWAIYFFFVRPMTQNPNGTCGGNACASTSTLPIAIQGSVNIFTTGSNHYTFLVEVANPNANQGAQNFDYTFKAYDAANNLIASFPGQSFIYPKEQEYLVMPNEATVSPIDHVTFEIGNTTWVPSNSSVPNFGFPNIQIATTSELISLQGQIVNQDVSSFNEVTIVAIFKDSNGNPVGASETKVENLQAGSSGNFTVSYPALSNINPSNYQIFGYGLKV